MEIYDGVVMRVYEGRKSGKNRKTLNCFLYVKYVFIYYKKKIQFIIESKKFTSTMVRITKFWVVVLSAKY